MPTVIRRSETIALGERRRDVLHSVSWQVTSKSLEFADRHLPDGR